MAMSCLILFVSIYTLLQCVTANRQSSAGRGHGRVKLAQSETTKTQKFTTLKQFRCYQAKLSIVWYIIVWFTVS